MASADEQRVSMKLCIKLCKTATETLDLIHTAFGDSKFSRTTLSMNGTGSLNSVESCGSKMAIARPSTSLREEVIKRSFGNGTLPPSY